MTKSRLQVRGGPTRAANERASLHTTRRSRTDCSDPVSSVVSPRVATWVLKRWRFRRTFSLQRAYPRAGRTRGDWTRPPSPGVHALATSSASAPRKVGRARVRKIPGDWQYRELDSRLAVATPVITGPKRRTPATAMERRCTEGKKLRARDQCFEWRARDAREGGDSVSRPRVNAFDGSFSRAADIITLDSDSEVLGREFAPLGFCTRLRTGGL
jgi:hypothetical protein